MTEYYRDVCRITLEKKDSRDQLIRKTVVTMIPTLASYDPTTFAERYLHQSMQHLLGLLRKERDRRDGNSFYSTHLQSLTIRESLYCYRTGRGASQE